MNVQEMIAALQQQDPSASAGDAIKAVRAAEAHAKTLRLLTPAGVLEGYEARLTGAKAARDSKGNGNDDPERVAFNAIRSDVQFALQLTEPGPTKADLKPDEDMEDLAHFQKKHNKRLWKRADELVAAAGITEKGRVA